MDYINTKNLKKSNLFVENRLATFKTWLFKKGSCSASEMPEAGFVLVEGDTVQCFFCLKQLDGWEETDDPMAEHENHSGKCPYILLMKKKRGHTSVKDALRLLYDTQMFQEAKQLHKLGYKGSAV